MTEHNHNEGQIESISSVWETDTEIKKSTTLFNGFDGTRTHITEVFDKATGETSVRTIEEPYKSELQRELAAVKQGLGSFVRSVRSGSYQSDRTTSQDAES